MLGSLNLFRTKSRFFGNNWVILYVYYRVFVYPSFSALGCDCRKRSCTLIEYFCGLNIVHTDIEGTFIIEPGVFNDSRGYFFESFNKKVFLDKTGLDIDFVQDNESMSSYGVMRGLHFQFPPFAQAKLVRCVKGSVLDIALDIRKGSPTFGQYVSVELTEENHRQFFIPKGFAHGFAVLSETAIFQYKCDEFYHPESEGGISILDESLCIDWRIPADMAVLSEKDTRNPLLKDFDSPFIYGAI